jgi:hypothetical protein
LVWDRDTDRLQRENAETLPNVPTTVQTAYARLYDSGNKTMVYVKQYADGLKHFVVVRPDGIVIEQGPWKGRLITQFPKGSGRQRQMEVRWERETRPASDDVNAGASRAPSVPGLVSASPPRTGEPAEPNAMEASEDRG